MFSHMMVGSNDLSRSKIFYDAIFTAIGGSPGKQDDMGRLVYQHRGTMFLVTSPIDGKPATPGNGMTIGFGLINSAECDAWHAAGAAHGGSAIEAPPGIREGGFGKLYLAYLRDPDGNKLCALHPVTD